jgi:hypothetical protein
MQNVCGLLHLNHERRLAARDVVRCPDARVNAIDDTDFRPGRWNERPCLGHKADERRLPQIGRLAAHVRPGEDHKMARCGVERHVVRHECPGAVALDDRMPSVDDRQLVAVMHMRFGVVRERGRLREARQHVERGE